MLVTDFFTAFQKGKQLVNSEIWKNRTLATNTLFALLSATAGIVVAFGYKIEVSTDELQAIAGGITALVAVGNNVMLVVTTTKVGLPARSGADEPRVPPAN